MLRSRFLIICCLSVSTHSPTELHWPRRLTLWGENIPTGRSPTLRVQRKSSEENWLSGGLSSIITTFLKDNLEIWRIIRHFAHETGTEPSVAMWWCSRYLWLTSKGVILLSKCGNFNNRPDNSDWCSWLGLLYPDVFGAWYIFQGVNCRCYGRGRCHMPDNSSSDKLHAFFVFILCYKTYSFSSIHSIVHLNVHYCSLSFTLTVVLLCCIHIICSFASAIKHNYYH